eukprot:3010858-Rhodomonas_salina.1
MKRVPVSGHACAILLLSCLMSAWVVHVDAACGDGITQAGEECDDGNENDLDGCSNACVCATQRTYFIHEVATGGPNHESFCQAGGGTMVTIFNQAEQDEVMNFLDNYPKIGPGPGTPVMHIGLHRCTSAPQSARSSCADQDDSNEFIWGDGTRPTWDRWSDGQPSHKKWPIIDTAFLHPDGSRGRWAMGDQFYWGICQVIIPDSWACPKAGQQDPNEACVNNTYTEDCNILCDRHVNCTGNGRCSGRTGVCICDEGYSGAHCEITPEECLTEFQCAVSSCFHAFQHEKYESRNVRRGEIAAGASWPLGMGRPRAKTLVRSVYTPQSSPKSNPAPLLCTIVLCDCEK